MRWFVGLLAAVALVAGVTYGAVTVLDLDGDDPSVSAGDATTTAPADPAPEEVPAAGQAFVTGTVTRVHIEGAVVPPLPTPLEIATPERGMGAGGTFEGITVDGEDSTIVWDAGRPLAITGEGGALVLGPVVVDGDAEGLRLGVDGVQSLAPGAYRITTPVAVGTAGVARPQDSASFEAGEGNTLSLRGGAVTALPAPVTITGPGTLVLEGTLEVTRPDGTVSATQVELGGGPFEITLAPAEGGFTVEATLQGPIEVT